MLCFNFCRSPPACTIFSGLATVSPRAVPYICRSVTGKQYISYVPLQHFRLLSNQFQSQSTTRRGISHWPSTSQSLLLPSRLAPLGTLPSFSNSAFTQSSIRLLVQKSLVRRSHATANDPNSISVQPLDPSYRRQSIRRGFIISLPILAIYLLLYLLNIRQQQSELSRQHMNTGARFWSYRRQESFQNVASLCTYVTSQFTHDRLIALVIDSLALVGIASIVGSVFNRRTFFAVYVIGGFLAAGADCAWARATNPCRSITVAQIRQNNTLTRLINEANAKRTSLKSQVFSMEGLFELLTNLESFVGKLEEIIKHEEFIQKNSPSVRDWWKWTGENRAARGSLVCLSMPSIPQAFTLLFFCKKPVHSDANIEQHLVSIVTLTRPLTIINLWGTTPRFQLWKLTASFFLFSLYDELVIKSP